MQTKSDLFEFCASMQVCGYRESLEENVVIRNVAGPFVVTP